MKQIVFVVCILVAAIGTPQLYGDDQLHVYMPDGQLMSRPVKVYVSGTNLSEALQPKLRLVGPYLLTKSDSASVKDYPARQVIPGQHWSEEIAGQPAPQTGTVLLFDLSTYSVQWYKAMMKFAPLLSWNAAPSGKEPERVSLLGSSVYLGRLPVAVLWTAVVVGVLVLAIWRWSVQKKRRAVFLLCGETGYLSVWRTQLAAWTIVVGSLVFCFGLLRLEVPKIPESIVALMGLSVATGGFSSAQSQSNVRKRRADGGALPRKANPPQFADLISSFSPTSPDGDLSIPKAQMVFWTGLILVLFVTKSLLIGELWPVPWEVVALTGVSQAGYVSEKVAKKPTEDGGNESAETKKHP